MAEAYFIVLDEKGPPGPNKYCLMRGDPDTAVGIMIAEGPSQKPLEWQAPSSVNLYRVRLQRTDGCTGKVLIRKAKRRP